MEYNKVVISNLALIAILALLSIQLLDDGWGWIQNINLIIHEAGHGITAFGSRSFSVFMGSGLEILIPLAFVGYFLYRNDVAGSLFGIWWIGTALVHIGYYMADAVPQILPLLGGKHVIHDWNYLFITWNVLPHATTIGKVFISVGYLAIICSLLLLAFYVADLYKLTGGIKKKGDAPRQTP